MDQDDDDERIKDDVRPRGSRMVLGGIYTLWICTAHVGWSQMRRLPFTAIVECPRGTRSHGLGVPSRPEGQVGHFTRSASPVMRTMQS
jgi:hypothetical protein